MSRSYTVYGSNAPWGAHLGEFTSETDALDYALSGRAGDFGDGVYVAAADVD